MVKLRLRTQFECSVAKTQLCISRTYKSRHTVVRGKSYFNILHVTTNLVIAADTNSGMWVIKTWEAKTIKMLLNDAKHTNLNLHISSHIHR